MSNNQVAVTPVVKAKDKVVAFFGLMFATAMVWAGTASSDDPFLDFLTTVEDWSSGALGVGIAITSVIFGAVRAVGNNNPMSALAGLALAAFIHWGPTIIKTMILGSSAVM